MQLLIADTGPVNYLILIGQIDLLPRMFEKVVLPDAVQVELSNPGAPKLVQRWVASLPSWVEIVETQSIKPVAGIHKGEAAAIALALAVSLHADLLLMDDRKGVTEAERQGLKVTGTLGILDLAAERGFINFDQTIKHLRETTFRIPGALLDGLLEKHAWGGDFD